MNALGSSPRSPAKFSAPCYGVYAGVEILKICPKVAKYIQRHSLMGLYPSMNAFPLISNNLLVSSLESQKKTFFLSPILA